MHVTVLDHQAEGWFVGRSRHCHDYLDAPAGASTTEWWAEILASRTPGAVVLPCNDVALEFVARRRDELVASGCRPIELDPAGILTALNKDATYERARALGISTPLTVRLADPGDIEAAEVTLELPFAVKPASSHELWQGLRRQPELFERWLAHPKGMVLERPGQLGQLVRPLLELGVEMLATEVIVGPDDGYCSYYSYLLPDGQPLVHFTKRKPRQYPIHFGEGTFHVTAWQSDVAELGLKLFQGLGLRGICNVEFKRDTRRGELRLVEINARLTASDALERLAGLDLPWIAYCRAIGAPVEVPETFPDGLCQWLPRRDLRAFRSYRAAGELSTAEWLRSLAHPQSFTVFAPGDPGPWLATLGRSARSLTRRLLGVARARQADRDTGALDPSARTGARRRGGPLVRS